MRSRRRRSRRNRRQEILILAGLIIILIVANVILPEPEDRKPEGLARVIDGDSLVVDSVEIRLRGIDAPEMAQQCERAGRSWDCGKESARRLRFFIRGALISCSGNSFDQHGRLLAICRNGDREINRWLVEEGWAVSFGDYPFAERKARKARRGIWQGSFQYPSDWRKEQGGR